MFDPKEFSAATLRKIVELQGTPVGTLSSRFESWIRERRVPPVLLLTQAAGTVCASITRPVAHWIARRLVCSDLCGGCGSENALITEVLPESVNASSSSTGSQTLKIDQFRQLKEKMGFSEELGTYRVILIPHAEKMTVQAANSLLKLLEEPPAGWVFVLTTADRSLLLPTLISRCIQVRLRPVPAEIWNTEQDDPKLLELLHSFLNSPSATLTELLELGASQHTHFESCLSFFEQILSELLVATTVERQGKLQAKFSEKLSPGLLNHIQNMKTKMGDSERVTAFWYEQVEALSKIRQELHNSINRKLVLQTLLLPWLKA